MNFFASLRGAAPAVEQPVVEDAEAEEDRAVVDEVAKEEGNASESVDDDDGGVIVVADASAANGDTNVDAGGADARREAEKDENSSPDGAARGSGQQGGGEHPGGRAADPDENDDAHPPQPTRTRTSPPPSASSEPAAERTTPATTDATASSSVASSAASETSARSRPADSGSPERKRRAHRQLERMQRRVPASLDLDYITPRIIGMAPPRAPADDDYSDDDYSDDDDDGGYDNDDRARGTHRGRKNKRGGNNGNKRPSKPKGNDAGDLSAFLERRHSRRYLLFNVSDDDADDGSLVLLGGQVVHLPWGSPRQRRHASVGVGGGANGHHGAPGRPVPGSPSPYLHGRKQLDGVGGGGGKRSSGTPAVSRVMDICYALHAYLSVPPGEPPPRDFDSSSSPFGNFGGANDTGTGRGRHPRRHGGPTSNHPPATVACIYCGNGKTRTGVIAACYLRFCDEVQTSLGGFEVFCRRRGIASSSSSNPNSNSSTSDGNGVSSHIPPSLRQFFANFDDAVSRKRYPHPEPLMLRAIGLQGVPVDDMPCVDIWEHGDVPRRQIYSSHDLPPDGDAANEGVMVNNSVMNEWDDEEGYYRVGKSLSRDFTLVCRFGGEFAADADDPSKVLFRYVNCPDFLGEGTLELGMADVDMMRRYADSFDDEDFLLTLTFDGVDDCNGGAAPTRSPGRARGTSFSCPRGGPDSAKFDGRISEVEREVVLQGWRVLSDAHLSHLSPNLEEDTDSDSDDDDAAIAKSGSGLSSHPSFKLSYAGGHEVNFRHIALQFANGDEDLARAELTNGLFGSFFHSDDLSTKASRRQQSPQRPPPLALEPPQLPILESPVAGGGVAIQEEEDGGGVADRALRPISEPTSEAAEGQVEGDAVRIGRGASPGGFPAADAAPPEAVDVAPAIASDHGDGQDTGGRAPGPTDKDRSRPGVAAVRPASPSPADEIDHHTSTRHLKDDKPEIAAAGRARDSVYNGVVTPSFAELSAGQKDIPADWLDEEESHVEEQSKYDDKNVAIDAGTNNDTRLDSVDESLAEVTISKNEVDDTKSHSKTPAQSLWPGRLVRKVGEVDWSKYAEDRDEKRKVGEVDWSKYAEDRDEDESTVETHAAAGITTVHPGVEEGGVSTTNNAFAGGSQSSLLEAIKMRRGLKNSISTMSANDPRCSLLREIQRTGSFESHHGSSTMDETVKTGNGKMREATMERTTILSQTLVESSTELDDGKNVDGTLRVSIVDNLDDIDFRRSEADSLDTDAGVMMVGLDTSVSTADEAAVSDAGDQAVSLISEANITGPLNERVTGSAQVKEEESHNKSSHGSAGRKVVTDLVSNRDGEDAGIIIEEDNSRGAEVGPVVGDFVPATELVFDSATVDGGQSANVVATVAATALKKKTQVDTAFVEGPGGDGPINAVAEDNEPLEDPPINRDTAFEKYSSMLEMGLPMGAVKNAMQRDGLDPELLNLHPNKPLSYQMGESSLEAAYAVDGSDEIIPTESIEETLSAPSLMKSDRDSAKNSLNAMLSNRNINVTVEKYDGALNIEDEAQQEDPKAAVTAMISRRAPPIPAEKSGDVPPPMLNIQLEAEVKDENSRKSLMTSIIKRASRTEEPGSTSPANEEVEENDPRSALMAMNRKRAIPLEESNSEVLTLSSRSEREPVIESVSSPSEDELTSIAALPVAAALKKKASVEIPRFDSQSTVAEMEKENSPMIREDPRFSKYFHMLKMGLPMGAVKNAMQRDQEDPAIMDLDPEKSLESQQSPEKDTAGDDVPLKEDDSYKKYFRMLRVGLAMGAVKNAMQRDGIDPDMMDLDPNKSMASQMDAGPPLHSSSIENRAETASALHMDASQATPCTPLLTHPDRNDARDALNEMLTSCGGQGALEYEHGVGDLTAASTATFSRRSQTTPTIETISTLYPEEEAEERDPRAALTAMLSKRSQPNPAEELASEPTSTSFANEKAEENNPRAALTAMLSRRVSPTQTEQFECVSPPMSTSQSVGQSTLNAMLANRGSQSEVKVEVKAEENDPRAALMAMLSKRAPASQAGESKSVQPSTSSGRNNAKNALDAMLANRGGQSAVEQGEESEDNDPRAALSAMLSKRAPPTPSAQTQNISPAKEEAIQEDPRAALMSMLSKRAPPTPLEEHASSPPPTQEGNQEDPRAALMSMLNKRAMPTPAEEAKSAPLSAEETKHEDPRAALMSMLNKRAPPIPADHLTSASSQETKQEDPRAALMSMLSKRAPPTHANQPTSVFSQEVKQEDPRAALMSMLSKRAPPTPSEQPTSASSQTAKQEDPRAALMSMLSKRAPPTPADQPASDLSQEAKQEDPRAALMSMLNKRAPSADQPTSASSQKGTHDDPRAALMSMLSNRAPPAPAEQPTSASSQSAKQEDPRSALMSMLNKRAPPTPQDEPRTAPSTNGTGKAEDPRAALNAMIDKRAYPAPAEGPEVQSVEPAKGAPVSMDIGSNAAAALKKVTPAEGSNNETQSSTAKVLDVATGNGGLPKIQDDPRFSKYFRMLKMGLPMGAVKNAVMRDQQDPTIMDLDPEKSLASQRPPENDNVGDDGPPLNKDPAYEKYFKMLKMGLPIGAVKNAMERDGADPDIMDLDPNKSVASQMKKNDDGPPLKDDPKYSKYFKMLKMGLPMGAVKNAIQRDGLDPDIMDLDPEKSIASQLDEDEDTEDTGPPLKEDPKYIKYFKMLKMGLPKGAVQNAMERDGLDPSIMDLDPQKSVASQLDKEEDTGPPLKEDPKYTKYFKMLKMGLPMGAVKNAMGRDGEDPSIMDLDPEKSVASQLNKEEELVDKGPPLKDDPIYGKYFKMLKMGLPMGAVQNALQRDGHDPSIMDLDPEKSVEYQKAMASGKSKKKKSKKVQTKQPKGPKVRRKKIFWSPIEESKINRNSLWSMVRGTFDFGSLNVDQDEFESLFTDSSNPADKKKVVKENPAGAKQKKSVQVIDAKRGMNGGIILARIKIEFSALAQMVTEMDCGKLDDTQLKALREFLPTKEEKFAIQGYVKGASSSSKTKEAAIADFCMCEKYMLAMMQVEMADEKFEAMLFKYQFDNKLNELMDGVTTLINACEEVQKSVRLRKLMAMILMLGNQINTGGTGMMAQGFTLDALLKLDEAKAFDKKTSVLQYLVKLVKANEPDLLKVHDEMPSIGPSENVIVEALVSELKELNDQLTSVKGTASAEGRRKRDGTNPQAKETALEKLRHQKSKIKDVAGVHMFNQPAPIELTAMEKFALYAEKRANEAFARIDEVQENFKGVLEYFGENPTMTSTDFFGTLNKFIATFDSALEFVQRVEALKLAEEKKEAAQLAKEAKKKAAKTKKAAKAATAPKRDSDVVVKESKGKLDLSGQRKKSIDPFAGPESDEESETKSKNEVGGKKSTTRSSSSSVPAQEKEEPDPRAALMDMISKRAPPTEKTKKPPSSREEAQQEDLRVLKRAAPVEDPESEVPPPGSQTDTNEQRDTKKALSDMLSKRAPQAPQSPTNIVAQTAAAARKKEQPSLPSMSSISDAPGSPGNNGFFPATTRDVHRDSKHAQKKPSAREARYETKTSSKARGVEATTLPVPPSSPLAHGIKKDLLAEKKAQLHHIDVPKIEKYEKDPPVLHNHSEHKRENWINPHIEADTKTEAKVMLVAAMAAASARSRSSGAEKTKSVDIDVEAEGNATLAAAAAWKKSTGEESEKGKPTRVIGDEGTSPPSADRMAKKPRETVYIGSICVDDNEPGKVDLKENYTKGEASWGIGEEESSPPSAGTRTKNPRETVFIGSVWLDDNEPGKVELKGDSAAGDMSAGAVEKKRTVERTDVDAELKTANVSAVPRNETTIEKPNTAEPKGESSASGEAMSVAAQAPAQYKNRPRKKERSLSGDNGAPMGIAAMAAAAARKKASCK